MAPGKDTQAGPLLWGKRIVKGSRMKKGAQTQQGLDQHPAGLSSRCSIVTGSRTALREKED